MNKGSVTAQLTLGIPWSFNHRASLLHNILMTLLLTLLDTITQKSYIT